MNPILKMCAVNARVVGESGARKFDKTHARGRIDGMVALAMVEFVMSSVELEDSVYEQMARRSAA